MSFKGPKVAAAKCQIGSYDASKLTISQFAANGLLTNPGVSIFGESLQFGVVRAGVTIGLPMAMPGLSLPMSLEVTGVSMIWGQLTVNAVHLAYGLKTSFAPNIKNSYTAKNQADINNSLSVRNKTSIFNGISKFNGKILAELITAKKVVSAKFLGDVNGCVGIPAGCKSFDIPHETKPGKRIRHVCVEGPEAGIYIRGRLKDSNVIQLPEYWDGLVDYDTITVQLQPIGERHYHLNVMEIDKEKIVVRDSDDKPIDCFYHVWVARWINPGNHDEKLHIVYDGESPADYPGNPENFSVAGWDYDRKEDE